MRTHGFACFLLLALASLPGYGQNEIRDGVLDLRTWDPASQASIALDGKWEFYWNKLLVSSDLTSETRPALAEVSVPWNEQVIDGVTLPNNGVATYRLTILLPPLDSVGFAVPAVFNSYAFLVNDSLVCESGKVSTDSTAMVPAWRPNTVSVPATDTMRVVFQIANFQDTRGGCAEIIRIGDHEYVQSVRAGHRMSGRMLIVIFALTSLSGFIIYFIVRSRSYLFLALLAFAFTLRFLFSDLYFFYDLDVDVAWEWVARIEYGTIPFIIMSASLFISSIYPQEFRRVSLYFFAFVNALFVVTTWLVPSSFFSKLLLVIQIVGLAFLIYTIYVVIKAIISGRVGAWVTAVGILVFASVGFYNIYAFLTLTDLNRTVIHSGYAIALILNVISLFYRTPVRLRSEEDDILRFSDFYTEKEKLKA